MSVTVPYDPPGPWRSDAACRGMDPAVFVPEKGDSLDLARSVCRSCPSAQPCLIYALSNSTTGVWGGLSENQREQLVAVMGRMKVCGECEAAFHTYVGRDVFCSAACQEARRARIRQESRDRHRAKELAQQRERRAAIRANRRAADVA